jgi:Xaa-Pro aminopeptidase
LEEKNSYLWDLRQVKDSEELARMRKAAIFADKGMQRAYDIISPGKTEIDVAAEIEYEMRKHGSYGVAFDTIVASGPHSAIPHGGCGERKLKTGDLVVIDMGATYKHYRSDMTRTIIVGKASQKQKKIYNVVKNAQETAYQNILADVKAKVPDAKAREIIQKAGYGKHFVHGLGHGVGLEVHEHPVLNSSSKDILKERNVVTDEPGIYIIGFGGIRIEDTILVKKEKSERLTKSPPVLEI